MMTPYPTRRLRFACVEPLKYGANAAAEFDEPEWPRFIRITDITEDGQLKPETFRSLPPKVAEDYLLDEGDILLARSGSIGRSFIYKPDWGTACFAEYLIRARLSEEFDPRFVYWSLNGADYWGWVESIASRSTIQNVSAERYADCLIPSPPLDDQRRIARYLDEKTARIDGLIAKKRALLDRLAEKHQALITRAVTKGLNPDVPMTETGLSWLGQIPAHWDCCGLGQKIMLQRGVDITKDQRVDGPYPVVSSGGVDYHHDHAFCTGPGVIVGRKGSAGKLHYVSSDYWPHDTTLYVREFRGNLPKFVWYMLHTLDLTSFDSGSSNPTVNRNRVHPMKTAWPTAEEQSEIVAALDYEMEVHAKRVKKITASIEVLEEYRKAIITASVTGKMG